MIRDQPDACELKWSLFYSAVLSGNPSVIKPYPVSLFLDKETREVQLELLQETVKKVPPFHEIPTTCLDADVVELLHWIFIQNKDPRLTRISVSDYPEFLQKALSSKPKVQWPQYVFQVQANSDSNSEKRFQDHKALLNSPSDTFAFHGSKLQSFFSILNFGLAQHLCKRDLYGDGTYLSTAMDVAFTFSSSGSAWPHSHLFGDNFSCLVLCEYVPNPMYIRTDPKVPKNYVVLTNNEIVRVRYVLVFTKRRRKPQSSSDAVQNSSPVSSLGKNFAWIVLYLGLLGLVGMINRGNFLRDHFWSLWE